MGGEGSLRCRPIWKKSLLASRFGAIAAVTTCTPSYQTSTMPSAPCDHLLLIAMRCHLLSSSSAVQRTVLPRSPVPNFTLVPPPAAGSMKNVIVLSELERDSQ